MTASPLQPVEQLSPRAETPPVEELFSGLAVRVKSARDQGKNGIRSGATKPGWSVHGGDQFLHLKAAGAFPAQKRRGMKRNVSFDDVREEVLLPACLKTPSIIGRRRPAGAPGAPTDVPTNSAQKRHAGSEEATLLVRPDGADGEVGFEVSDDNVVISVSAASRHGTLREGDRILAVNGHTVKAGDVVAALPTARAFVFFEVDRASRPPSASSDAESAGSSRPSSAQRTPTTTRRSFGLGFSRRSQSSNNLAMLEQGASSPQPEAAVTLSVFLPRGIELEIGEADEITRLSHTQQQPPTPQEPPPDEAPAAAAEPPLAPASTPPAPPRPTTTKSTGRPAACRLAVGDRIVGINGTPLKQGESARDALDTLRAEHAARRGGMKRSPPDGADASGGACPGCACMLTIERASADAPPVDGVGAVRALSKGLLGAAAYKMGRYIENSRTTLCDAGKEHKVALQLQKELWGLCSLADRASITVQQVSFHAPTENGT